MIELVPIDASGRVSGEAPPPGLPQQVAEATALMYASLGFVPPWIGYLTRRDGQYVGTCGFKGPPSEHRVEMGYFTFPGNEGQGLSTEAARRLIALALYADPAVTVTARTLPEEGPSAHILRKLGFRLIGPVSDPEEGTVWEWRLDPGSGAVAG